MCQLFSCAVIGQCKSARYFSGERCKSCVLKCQIIGSKRIDFDQGVVKQARSKKNSSKSLPPAKGAKMLGLSRFKFDAMVLN